MEWLRLKKSKIVFEERTDEGVRTFKDNCIGTIRTIDSGGDKRVAEIKQIGNITPNPKRENPQTFRVYDKEGYIECKVGGVADLSYPESETRRGRVQDNGDICPTITEIGRAHV